MKYDRKEKVALLKRAMTGDKEAEYEMGQCLIDDPKFNIGLDTAMRVAREAATGAEGAIPTLTLVTQLKDESYDVHVMQMQGDLPETSEEKQQMMADLGARIAREIPDRVVAIYFTCEAWEVKLSKEEAVSVDSTTPSERADKIEALICVGLTPDLRSGMIDDEIIRSKKNLIKLKPLKYAPHRKGVENIQPDLLMAFYKGYGDVWLEKPSKSGLPTRTELDHMIDMAIKIGDEMRHKFRK